VDQRRVASIVAKIRQLQFVTRSTGFITTRTQGDLLKTLNAEELALAGQLLHQQSDERVTDDRANRC
jgi:hypothetical protein